jgi:hypothetical protein
MKTTVEIPDTLYRQIKARAALKGQSIKDFLVEAVRAKLVADRAKPKKESKKKTGWEAAFGAADPAEVAEVQRIIDEEFSRIDPDAWK